MWRSIRILSSSYQHVREPCGSHSQLSVLGGEVLPDASSVVTGFHRRGGRPKAQDDSCRRSSVESLGESRLGRIVRAEGEGVNRNRDRGSGHPFALPHYVQELIATICCGNNLLSGTSYRVDNDIAVTKSGLRFPHSYDDSTERVFPTVGSLVIVARGSPGRANQASLRWPAASISTSTS